MIFVPLGLAEAALDPLADAAEDDSLGRNVAALAAISASALVSLLGEVFYVAVVSAVVVAASSGEDLRFGELARRLPVGRLLAADLSYAVLVAAGLLALIIPGLVFLAWFALVAPAIEIEHRGFRDAFARSRELVRRRFWLVLGVTLPLVIASDAISSLAFSGAAHAFGHSLAGEWAGAALAEMLTAPLFGLFVVVLFLRLREMHPGDPRHRGLPSS